MNEKTAIALVKAGEEIGIELRLLPHYRGRCMSRPTHAVSADRISHLLAATARMALSLSDWDDEEAFVREMNEVSTDADGRGIVAY